MILKDRENRVRRKIAEATRGREKSEDIGSLPRATVQGWIKGPTLPKLGQFLELCEATGREPAWFFDDAPDLMVNVQRLSIQAGAGVGRHNHAADVAEIFPFPKAFLRTLGLSDDAKLRSLRAAGDSMAPTIEDNALQIVDEKDRGIRAIRNPRGVSEDGIYVFLLGRDLRVKRLNDAGKGYVAIISDNVAAHPVEIISLKDQEGFKVLGRVVWWSNLL